VTGGDRAGADALREQAALRRVATLVAREATPAEVFAIVAREAATVLGVPLTSVCAFAGDGTATQVGAWGTANPFPVGTSWPVDPQSVSGAVFGGAAAARVDDYGALSGDIARGLGALEIRSSVGAAIRVEGRVWGVLMALSSADAPLPEGTEERLAAFTELIATAIANTQARDDLRRLAREQAALRRVATLVARGAPAQEVFEAVCEETGMLVGSASANLARFLEDDQVETLAGWSLRDIHVPAGTLLPHEDDTVDAVVLRTGAPGRFDRYDLATSEFAAFIRARGIRSEVAAPVLVDGAVWGALIAGTDAEEPLPEETERQVASFAELVATALANATARTELIASRARIVAAGDAARRRIERNLHDGIQQRLVALILELRALERVPVPREELERELSRLQDDLGHALDELREIARGLHPALLSQAGLSPALRSLASRSPVPVELAVTVEGRLPAPVEVAAYYLVSEALANAAKHADASLVSVAVSADDGTVTATVRDDGRGGADPTGGSGLTGVRDRVEAIGGRLAIVSPPGGGTTLTAELPLAAQPAVV
jgi:signal transduction histidine kinase